MSDKPTHIGGKILDLVLTNCPEIISNFDIKDENEKCKSDHFPIEFMLDINVSRKKATKRKVFNFKKANSDGLNNSLRQVKWDHYIKGGNINGAGLIQTLDGLESNPKY